MTTANVEDQQQQQQENQEQQDEATLLTAEEDAQADAEFEAAFNTARGVEDSHAGKTTEQNDADKDKENETSDDEVEDFQGQATGDDDAEAQAAAAAATAEEEARKQAEADAAAKAAPVTVTKEQFDNLLAAAAKVSELEHKLQQTHNTAFGRIGNLQQSIADLKKSATTGKPLSAVQLKRLSAEFPEMASLLAEDLKESEAPADNTSQAPANQTVDADAIREQVRQETALEYEQKLIAARHSDWKDVVNSQDFERWKGSLRPEAQQLLANTSSADVFGDAIDAFKSFRAKQAEQAAAAQAAATAASNAHKQRDKRLDAAVTPNGVPASGSVVDEDEAFLAGFKSARGNR